MNSQRVVLVGIGHTHAHVVRQWAAQPPEQARLICISPFPVATYSGMLPGTLARQYERRQMQIELEPLCRAAGAELHVSAATRIDCQRRRVELANGEQIGYDLLSIGVGSVPRRHGIELDRSTATLVKPMQTLLDRVDDHLQAAVAASRRDRRRLEVVIVGGGAAGVEVAFCLCRRLEIDFPEVARGVTLLESHGTVLAAEHRRVQRLAARLLSGRGVEIRLESRVAAVRAGAVVLQSGDELPADLVIWAAGAAPPPLLERVELPKDDAGFLQTHRTLQSCGDERVFVVGDTGTIAGESYAKAGVYAVRQGPVLWANLNASLSGGRLRKYRPQKNFLRLLNTGDGRAILGYYGLITHGRWCWRLKDRIDRRFVRQYQQPPGG